jgi:hypothetical protein
VSINKIQSKNKIKQQKSIEVKNIAKEEIIQKKPVVRKSAPKKTGLKPYAEIKLPSSKQSDWMASPKAKLIDNYVQTKTAKLEKLKVEIDLPCQEDTQFKYSLITNSSDGKKIIYLKKKDNSKERSLDPEEALQKYAEDGDITHPPKKSKNIPIKNAKAYLTMNNKKEVKWESQQTTKHPNHTLQILQRFSSVAANGKSNILEIETLKSTSKESRSKKSYPKKKCKKKSNLVNYLGKNQTVKLKLQARVYKSTEKNEVIRPHTAQDYPIKPPSCSSKKSDKMAKSKLTESGNRYVKSSKSRMTSDLVNLINQTKKDVESLRAFRRNIKGTTKNNSKKTTYLSPLGDRSKDDAYGLSDTNKKVTSSNKSEKGKKKKKRVGCGSNSSRKAKVKTKQDKYQPVSGTIDLISRNDRWITQTSEDNTFNVELLNSRKSSHKRTTSIESSERSDKHSKNRFLVSKKYNNRMIQGSGLSIKDHINSWMGKSYKFGTSTSISKYPVNNTNIFNVWTPTSTTSQKVNIKGSLIAKKWLGYSKNKMSMHESDYPKPIKKRRMIRDLKLPRESTKKVNQNYEMKSPPAKSIKYGLGSKLRPRQIDPHSLSTSKRLEGQLGHNDLYHQILKSRKEK